MARDDDALVGELRAIKALMVLRLQRDGVRQSQIAAALGVSERTLGRMLPAASKRAGVTPAEDAA